MNKINIAMIGLGCRGYGLLESCLVKMDDIVITAVCDSYTDRAEKAKKMIKSKMGNEPIVTTNYSEIIGLDGVDCVLITTAWEDHIKIAIESMKLGKFVAMEVGGAYKLQDCFDLIKAYEESGSHCMMLENCCYGEYELMALNMARKGLFGDIIHCDGGYCHDLRQEIAYGDENRHYRLRNYINRNCENYPTHELGPIAKILNINNGNRILSLASFSSKSKGLHQYINDKLPENHVLSDKKFKQGDIITTVMTCLNGETITLSLDTTLPRFYSRKFTVKGTKGMYQEDGNIVILDGVENKFEKPQNRYWNNAKKYAAKYAHPLWDKKHKKYRKYGHGGMDWFVLRAMVETVKNKSYPPIDVYDAALWMSITPLSEESIMRGGAVIDVPDFAKTKINKNEEIISIFRLDK